MTLLLTWVVPDGIVMSADSAVTWSGSGGVEMTLSDAYKIVPCDRPSLKCGVSFAGLAMVSGHWTSQWLRDRVAGYRGAPQIPALAQQLATDLNGLGIGAQLIVLHVAGWEQGSHGDQADLVPRFLEVSNLDRSSGRVSDSFSVIDIITPDFLAGIRRYRSGDRTLYPMRFGSAGIPREFSTHWITNRLIPAQSEMAGAQLPQPNITSVAEYVRLLIGFVVDTQRVARQPAIVNRPIETLILFPESHNMVSQRY